jgi:Leucine-rich repeat (LRR) protein
MGYIEYQLVGNEILYTLNSLQEFKILQNKDKIIYLYIFNFNDSILDIEFDEFINLKELNIRAHHNLISLPSLESCVNLQNLYIWNNDNLTSIPSLDSCINLQKLDIYISNKLISLPSLEKCVKLQELNIWYNNLTFLPSLESCVNLQKLSLESNSKLISLPSLEKCVNLQKLYIYNNPNLTSLPSLEKCVNLEELTIKFNKLKQLPKGIQYLTKLEYYKKINNTVNNEYPENKCIPELIHYIIRKNYYYIPIMNYYTKTYM